LPALVAVTLALTAGARFARAEGELFVTFQANHTIAFTQGNGSAVGTTSGAPTVIPSGSYTIHFDDAIGVEGPSFDLQGPGVNLVEDLFFGEAPSATHRVDFLPGSTYTWRNDEQPNIVFTFATSSASVGGPSPSGGSSSGGTTTGTPSKEIVGSAIVPFRGALDAIVTSGGKLSFSRLDKPVSSLKAGRYTFAVDDESKASGFTVQALHKNPVTITSTRFVGSRNVTITLKVGRWFFYSPGGTRHQFFVTS